MDALDWLAHAIGQLYLAQPLTEVDFRKLKVRHPFMMHVTPLVLTSMCILTLTALKAFEAWVCLQMASMTSKVDFGLRF